jgi:hypothetical protein
MPGVDIPVEDIPSSIAGNLRRVTSSYVHVEAIH